MKETEKEVTNEMLCNEIKLFSTSMQKLIMSDPKEEDEEKELNALENQSKPLVVPIIEDKTIHACAEHLLNQCSATDN